MKHKIILILSLGFAYGKNPVYNEKDSLVIDNAILRQQPTITTSFDQMNNDMNSRLITVGEAHVDPEKHVVLNPFHTYDQDVVFVNDSAKVTKGTFVILETPTPFDDTLVKHKISNIEQDIYSLYSIKSESERKDFIKEQPNAIIPFMMAINQLDGNLTLEEQRVYDKIKELTAILQKNYKENKNKSFSQELFKQAKELTNLVDRKELVEQQLENLDTPLFGVQKAIQDQDKPLQLWALRVTLDFQRGNDFVNEAYSDLENFVYYAQRKAKVMKVYRKILLLRAKYMFKDLETQQSAVIKLQQEWAEELKTHTSYVETLMNLSNKVLTALPTDIPKKRAVLEDCLNSMVMFPQIQKLCDKILRTPDIEFDDMYARTIGGITAEVALYESSLQSIVVQMNLIRAVQLAVNSDDSPATQKNLNRLAQEIIQNQKYIRMNQNMNRFLIISNQFRLKDCTQNLALQNLDNVLNEVMLDNFDSLGEAVAMEDGEFLEIFKTKAANEELIESKLETLVGKMESEFSSETSQEVEELLEFVIQFRQKSVKLAKINSLMNVGKYNEVKQKLLDEVNVLKQRAAIYETQLNKARNLFENVFTMPHDSLVTQTTAFENDVELRAITRLEVKMAQNYAIVDDRLSASLRLDDAIKRLNSNLDGVVNSIQSVHQQFEFVEKYERDVATNEATQWKDKLKKDIESYQECTLFDPMLEQQLRSTRVLLRDAKAEPAAEKLKDLLYYADSFEFRLAMLEEDVSALQDEIKQDRLEKDIVSMNFHGEELYYKLQKLQKDLDVSYSIRRVSHLSVSEDYEMAAKVIYNMILSLEKEYFSINEHQKELVQLNDELEKAQKEGEDHLTLTAILSNVKKSATLGYKIWNSLTDSQSHSNTGDMIGARKVLSHAQEHIKQLITDYKQSLDQVERQKSFLDTLYKAKDGSMFAKIYQLLDHYKPQTYVVTSDVISDSFQKFWKLILNHQDYDANKELDEMTNKGLSYAGILWDKIMHVSEQTDSVNEDQKQMHEKYQKLNEKAHIPNQTDDQTKVVIKGHVHKDSPLNEMSPKELTQHVLDHSQKSIDHVEKKEDAVEADESEEEVFFLIFRKEKIKLKNFLKETPRRCLIKKWLN